MPGDVIDEIDESVITKSAGFLAKPFDITQILKTVNNKFTNSQSQNLNHYISFRQQENLESPIP